MSVLVAQSARCKQNAAGVLFGYRQVNKEGHPPRILRYQSNKENKT